MCYYVYCNVNDEEGMITFLYNDEVKARCWKRPDRYLCIPEPGRPDCAISIEIGVNGDAYPVTISPKVTKNLPVSFYSPTSGFKYKIDKSGNNNMNRIKGKLISELVLVLFWHHTMYFKL